MKKSFKYIGILFLLSISGCSDITDLNSEANISSENFYRNYTEIQTGLTGCYKGMQKPLLQEWSLTELRSDNVIMDSGSSNSVVNQDLSYLDQFYPSTSHLGSYTYWLDTYNNIRNTNVVLNVVGANYNPASTAIEYEPIATSIASADQCKSIAAEASFIRAYHYFNLVRLYGGVFLVDEVLTPTQAKNTNRSTVADIYKLIEADLKNAVTNGITAPYGSTAGDQIGRANSWAAKALLAKVYLTLNRKSEAEDKLDDIIDGKSGYGLESSYDRIFSTSNEMNKEILFAIRFKGGGLGMGNTLANLFATSNSGNAVIGGDGKGYNLPTSELTSATFKDAYGNSALTWDPSAPRRIVNWQFYDKVNSKKPYVSKFTSKSTLEYDSENDFPVIRYSDVLLMLAEAQGNSVASMGLINLVHVRAGVTPLTPLGTTPLATDVTTAVFEKALSNQRRWEFAFENQRWFDLLRFTTTTQTITTLASAKINIGTKSQPIYEYTPTFTGKTEGAEYKMKNHMNGQYFAIYLGFEGTLPLSPTKLFNYANPSRFLLPIPQYEIDTNSNIVIEQNVYTDE